MATTDITQDKGNGQRTEGAVCRFFRREEYGCDVGTPYPSAHDVEVMVRYCNGRFTECARYRMLAERWSGSVPAEGAARVQPIRRRVGRLAESASSEVARGVLQHELRTPVAAILAASEILDRRPDRDEQTRKRFVGIIRTEADRLKRTLEALFDGLEEGVEAGGDPEKEADRKAPAPAERRKPMQKAWNRGWSVVLAGTGINLALGILYTWSIFKGAIRSSIDSGAANGFNWDLTSINDPYAVCCLVFSFAMIVAGRLQDRFGPRLTAFVGGLLVSSGLVLTSMTTDYWTWVIGFGVLAGLGIGFGYSAATPPALKWFPPARTGLIAGIVVSGFGLAPVYIAPLATYLINTWGVHKAMLFFGIAFSAVVGILSLLLVNPPKDHLFKAVSDKKEQALKAAPLSGGPADSGFFEMVNAKAFYILWVGFFVGSGAGLMVIGSVAGMAKSAMGGYAFVAVALMAVGNAGGRIIAGILSDKIGRRNTLMIMLSVQAALMFAAIPLVGIKSPVLLVLLATFIGFNYGTNLSLFPALTKDYWGLKNFGTNYGVLFTAWGVGGFVMGMVSESLNTRTGSYTASFVTAGVMLIVGAALTLALKDIRKVAVKADHVPVATPAKEASAG
jgi:MFS family permease